jgi:SpoVK/Ycf46/Vps4 family AAA+-type ATPase
MKICPKCGEKIFIDDIEICPICGTKLIEEEKRQEQPKTKYTARITKDIKSEIDEEFKTFFDRKTSEEDLKKKKIIDEDEYLKQYIRENLIVKDKEDLPSWDDIGGLNDIKELIKKSIVIEMIENKPKAIEGWDKILFYGPPGTGKTSLAAATAKSIDATFFDVEVSKILSKYYGESSKIMNALFEVAREESPSVVFIDELDAIALSREEDIDEESRKVLSTLLTELDGLEPENEGLVIVIAATNTPKAIDEAILSRFGKKIEVPLPNFEASKEILEISTEKKGIGLEDESLYDELAKYCFEHKMSGRDIKFLCIEAIWNMLEELNPDLERLANEPYNKIKEYELKTRMLKKEDFEIEKGEYAIVWDNKIDKEEK